MKTHLYLFILLSFMTVAMSDEEMNEATIAMLADDAPALIVDTAFVAAAMQRGVLLWDARVQDEFRKGHIPGAVNFGDPLRALRSENSEDFIGHDSIEEIFGSVGLNPAREIIVYDGIAANEIFRIFAAQRAQRIADVYRAGNVPLAKQIGRASCRERV